MRPLLVDANLLLYAEDSLSPHHGAARSWWDATLSGNRTVLLAWVSLLAFLRISTNPRAVATPLPVRGAVARVAGWLAQPCVRLAQETPEHWETFSRLLKEVGVGANLTTDAHLAALAIEHQAELCSTDSDFARFPGLRWQNPLLKKGNGTGI